MGKADNQEEVAGIPSENPPHWVNEKEYMQLFNKWVINFEKFVTEKGKVQPGKFRAYGFKQPPHFWSEIKTGIRVLKLRFGKAPINLSPKKKFI